jgi:hypothetical protein
MSEHVAALHRAGLSLGTTAETQGVRAHRRGEERSGTAATSSGTERRKQLP